MKSLKTFYPIYIKIMIICTFIFAMQFCDSFSTELFSKLQSLYTTDFLIIGKHMDAENALSFVSLINFPFLLITALTPLGKALVDIWGRNKVYLLNICLLILGCILCIIAPTIYLFLLGNALVTFSCSLDIQYIYIVQEITPQYRATIRGITSGISALASMLLPTFRSLFIHHLHLSWRVLYIIAIILCILLLILSAIQLVNVTPDQPHIKPNCISSKELAPAKNYSNCFSSIKQFFLSLLKQKKFCNYALLLLLLGSATAGISYYNEPLLSFGIRDEMNINQILFIQPIALFICSILFGILADRINRRFMLILCTICSCFFLPIFCISANSSVSPIVPAIFWGLMYGSYFSSVNLLQLMIVELAPDDSTGKFSAIAVIIYGFGDAIGILFTSLLVVPFHITVAKLATTLPVLIISLVILISKKGISASLY